MHCPTGTVHYFRHTAGGNLARIRQQLFLPVFLQMSRPVLRSFAPNRLSALPHEMQEALPDAVPVRFWRFCRLLPGRETGLVVHASLVHHRDIAETAAPDHIDFIEILG